jgi:predicted lipid-binding transport protein (Tim44 family)
VVASFAGTESYYPSSAETSFTATEPAPTATPAPTAAPTMSDQYFAPAIAGLFVAIIVVGLLIILVLRKRP